jgi:hypothetical protein
MAAAIAAMSSSNRPRVFGLVNMMPATSWSSTVASAAMSTHPRSSLGTVTTS